MERKDFPSLQTVTASREEGKSNAQSKTRGFKLYVIFYTLKDKMMWSKYAQMLTFVECEW